MSYSPQLTDIQSIKGFPPGIPVESASLTGLTVTTVGPLQIIDQSDPPVQISGGTLQGISNSISIISPIYVQAATLNGVTVTGVVSQDYINRGLLETLTVLAMVNSYTTLRTRDNEGLAGFEFR